MHLSFSSCNNSFQIFLQVKKYESTLLLFAYLFLLLSLFLTKAQYVSILLEWIYLSIPSRFVF